MNVALDRLENILLIVAYYPPEINSSAQIYRDLAKNFSDKGHKVDVITSYPRDHCLLQSYDETTPLEEVIDNVYIHRVKHLAQRDNKILRGLEHFYIPFYYAWRLLKLIRDGNTYDVGIIYIAPLPLCYLGRFIETLCHIPVILNIEEFHPQELTDVGFLKSNLVISILKYIERSACKHARYISVHSPGGVQYLKDRGADSSKMSVVFNSIDTRVIDNESILSDFKEKHNLYGKFLISYGGLLSPFQGLDKILDVAKIVDSEFSDILFVIAGDGMIRDDLLRRIKSERISNVEIIPFLPREEYINFIKSSDISIVSLDYRMRSPVLPGKLAYLMGLETPIIALVNPECETAKVVIESKSGIVVNPNEVQSFKNAIQYIRNNPDIAVEFGKNGRKYMETHMTSEITTKQYQKIFRELSLNR